MAERFHDLERVSAIFRIVEYDRDHRRIRSLRRDRFEPLLALGGHETRADLEIAFFELHDLAAFERRHAGERAIGVGDVTTRLRARGERVEEDRSRLIPSDPRSAIVPSLGEL